MPAGLYNFLCEQGVTFRRTITLTDATNLPIDLEGAIARMQVRKDVKSDVVLIELSTENGRIQIGEEPGTLVLYISSDDTSTIERGGVYDLEIYTGSDDLRVLKGKFDLDPEVTR